MIPKLILLLSLGGFVWLTRRDIALRQDSSRAIWIPTLWLAILASRPFSMWLGGVGAGDDALEGSPADRLFYLVLIIAAFLVLRRRRFDWGDWIRRNKVLLAFYLYFLISVTWADAPFSSFKRLFKDFGNIFVLLVILTEKDPRSALKAVFVRCAYVLIPLSLVYIRYFPELGRRYGQSGGLEVIGVTGQKNSLGAMILCTGLFLIFDLIDNDPDSPKLNRGDKRIRLVILAIGLYLLNMCDSKTAILCLAVGTTILMSSRFRAMQPYLGRGGLMVVLAAGAFFVLDATFDLRERMISSMGRDMTFTGRTDVWRELLALKTNPIIGTGFCSIWSDRDILQRLPAWVSGSAHSGYLEMYLDGGFVGIFFLTMLLVSAYISATLQLRTLDRLAVVRFAVIVVTLIYNCSESVYGRISPGWFLFLLAAVHYRSPVIEYAEEAGIETETENTRAESQKPHFESA